MQESFWWRQCSDIKVKVTSQRPQTTTFEDQTEEQPKRNRTEVLLIASLQNNALQLGQRLAAIVAAALRFISQWAGVKPTSEWALNIFLREIHIKDRVIYTFGFTSNNETATSANSIMPSSAWHFSKLWRLPGTEHFSDRGLMCTLVPLG